MLRTEFHRMMSAGLRQSTALPDQFVRVLRDKRKRGILGITKRDLENERELSGQ